MPLVVRNKESINRRNPDFSLLTSTSPPPFILGGKKMNIDGVIIPKGYKSKHSLIETEIQIKKIKDMFENNFL